MSLLRNGSTRLCGRERQPFLQQALRGSPGRGSRAPNASIAGALRDASPGAGAGGAPVERWLRLRRAPAAGRPGCGEPRSPGSVGSRCRRRAGTCGHTREGCARPRVRVAAEGEKEGGRGKARGEAGAACAPRGAGPRLHQTGRVALRPASPPPQPWPGPARPAERCQAHQRSEARLSPAARGGNVAAERRKGEGEIKFKALSPGPALPPVSRGAGAGQTPQAAPEGGGTGRVPAMAALLPRFGRGDGECSPLCPRPRASPGGHWSRRRRGRARRSPGAVAIAAGGAALGCRAGREAASIDRGNKDSSDEKEKKKCSK